MSAVRNEGRTGDRWASRGCAWVGIIRDVSDGSKSPDLKAVEAELFAREPIFHQPEFGTGRADYAAQTAEDYWEVGASGRIYDREGILDGLVRRGKVPGDERWAVSDIRCHHLGADTYAFTYQLDQDGRLTRRLTIWRREADRWVAIYHQRTLIQPASLRRRRALAGLLTSRARKEATMSSAP